MSTGAYRHNYYGWSGASRSDNQLMDRSNRIALVTQTGVLLCNPMEGGGLLWQPLQGRYLGLRMGVGSMLKSTPPSGDSCWLKCCALEPVFVTSCHPKLIIICTGRSLSSGLMNQFRISSHVHLARTMGVTMEANTHISCVACVYLVLLQMGAGWIVLSIH
jgi:hypothetical protein